jgi:hypothetical protein
MSQSEVKPRRRGWRCCGGCLLLAGGLILVLILAVWLGPGLLRSAGVLPPGAEELFSGAPDPVATEAMNVVLKSADVDGVDVLVLPIAGSTDQLAVFSVNMETASAGGIQTQAEAEAFLADLVRQMAAQNEARGLAIEQVAVDFTDAGGDSALTIAAPADAFEAYAAGTISREAFLSQVEIDFSNLLDPSQIDALLEELP